MKPTYVKSCENCGKQFETNYEHTRYCGYFCYCQAKRRRTKEARDNCHCPHNTEVICLDKKCEACGWNPEVAQRRLDKILGRECTA